MKSEKGWLGSLLGALSLTPQRAAAFAGIIAVVGLAVIFWTASGGRQVQTNGGETSPVAAASPKPVPSGPSLIPGPESTGGTARASASPAPTPPAPQSGRPRPQPGPSYSGNNAGSLVAKGPNRRPQRPQGPSWDRQSSAEVAAATLPDEKKYLKTIESLEQAIKTSDSTTLSPTLRAEYERNLAVVDQAIAATQPAARRRPKDRDRAQFLFSAYQSKIDLLSAVAEQQSQFIAMR